VVTDRTGLTETELTVLAGVVGRDAEDLAADLARRPWLLHDILAAPETVESVYESTSLTGPATCPFLMFAVLARLAADDLHEAAFVNDWVGPRSRLPVFDVEPLHEFVAAPARLIYVARLLSSFVAPVASVPIESGDPWEIVDWLDAVDAADRTLLLRRLGDVALFCAGVHPDANGSVPLDIGLADRFGRSLGLSGDEVLELIDPASPTPGLDAFEILGARWYQEARLDESTVPPIVGDVARRFRPARRFLNHLTDRYLHPLSPPGLFAV
jgi:hypothetical protein